MNRFHKTEQNTGQPHFPISLFMLFFQTRRAGEACLERGSLSVLRPYRHRAVTVSSGSSCELFLLENLVRPMEEKTEPELKPGLSTFFSVVWQEQGRSVSSVRGQGPGASRPLTASSTFLIFIPLSKCSLGDVLAHTTKAPILSIQVLLAPSDGTLDIWSPSTPSVTPAH